MTLRLYPQPVVEAPLAYLSTGQASGLASSPLDLL
jgi:hypothetical protein